MFNMHSQAALDSSSMLLANLKGRARRRIIHPFDMPKFGTLDDLRDPIDGPGARPEYPYVTLIRYAILGSEARRLALRASFSFLSYYFDPGV
jgi:hypothetical protein